MSEDFWLILKLGFPLLWVVITAMAVGGIWSDDRKTRQQKITWTAVVCLLPFVGVGIWLALGYR